MSDLAFCTIVTKSYLAFARSLALSLKKYNPESEVFVLLADHPDDRFDPDQEPFRLIQLDDLEDSKVIERMSFYYTAPEFCFALRAWLHEYMHHHSGFQKWVYLDSDMWAVESLDPISRQLDESSILLSPHLIHSRPAAGDDRDVSRLEAYLIKTGLYNGGLVAVRADAQTESFVDWFKRRMEVAAFDERPTSCGDQFWLAQLHSYFDDVAVIRDPGINLAYWNLFERTITGRGRAIQVDGEPLRLFHFAGFDVKRPDRLTSYGFPENLGMEAAGIEELCSAYSRDVLAQEHESLRSLPYAFGSFPSGGPITPLHRKIYFERRDASEMREFSPYSLEKLLTRKSRRKRTKTFLFRLGRSTVRKIRKALSPDFRFELQ